MRSIPSLVRVAPYEVRKRIWDDAVAAAENHIKIGKAMQSHGASLIMRAIQAEDMGKAVKLAQQVTSLLKKGTVIERAARDKLIELHQIQPSK